MRSNLVLACVIALFHGEALAQDTLSRDNIASWHPVWRFAEGHDSARSDPAFDDSSWRVVDATTFDPGLVNSVGWPGVGWFRASFEVDSSLTLTQVGYLITLGGAAALYLDGTLIHRLGRPFTGNGDETPVRQSAQRPAQGFFPVLRPGTHHLALHVSNIFLSDAGETQYGFSFETLEPTDLVHHVESLSRSQAAKTFMLTGIAGLLAVIYLILIIFHPKLAPHSYFGLLSMLLALVVFGDLHSRLVTDPAAYLEWRRYVELAAIVAWVVAVRLIRVSFFKDPWKLFYPLLTLSALVGLHVYFDPIGGLWSLSILSFIATVELLRRIGLAVFLSRPGAWIVAVAAGIFVMAGLYDYLIKMGWLDPVYGATDLIHFGLVGFLVLFALFLGTEFTRVNRSLELKVLQVRQEGDKALQEEKINQQHRIDRIQAEFDNRRKEVEQEKARDVDQIRQSLTVANEHLKGMKERLARVEQVATSGKMAAGIVVDIKAVLRQIGELGTLSIDLLDDFQRLSGGGNEGKKADLLDHIRRNLTRIDEQRAVASSVIDDFLLHGATPSDAVSNVDINDLIERYLGLTVQAAKASFSDLKPTVERVLDPRVGTIRASAARLGQAMFGIFYNAIESLGTHAKEAGIDFQPTITVSTQRLEHAVLIRVRDNGPGVPQSLRDRVFEPFFSTKPENAGLGLSIAHQVIVDELDGTFGLEHFKEQGAGFYITLPLSPSPEEEHPASE